MSPSDAIQELLLLPGWTEARIAAMTGTSQSTINRIKRGASPTYVIGTAIVSLIATTDTSGPAPATQQEES